MSMPAYLIGGLFLLGVVLSGVSDPMRRGWLRWVLSICGGSLMLTAAYFSGYVKALSNLGFAG